MAVYFVFKVVVFVHVLEAGKHSVTAVADPFYPGQFWQSL
jgi:hypothetical protein